MGDFYSGALELDDSAVVRHQNAHLTGKRSELCTFPVRTNGKENSFFIARHQSDGRRRHLHCGTSLGAESVVDFDGRRPTGATARDFKHL